MANFIDRRPITGNPTAKGKSTVNRQRFIRRYKEQLKKSVQKHFADKYKIGDPLPDNFDTSIPKKDISEPIFHTGKGGRREQVHPGNDRYYAGDTVERQQGGQGNGSGDGDPSDSGQGEDDFTFQITQDEYLKLLFDDLELPNLDKMIEGVAKNFKSQRAGTSTTGVESNRDDIQSLKTAIKRRNALGAGRLKDELIALFEKAAHTANTEAVKAKQLTKPQSKNMKLSTKLFDALLPEDRKLYDSAKFIITDGKAEVYSDNEVKTEEKLLAFIAQPSEKFESYLIEFREKAAELAEQSANIPFLDDNDIRYKRNERVPLPDAKAHMFITMDISASMDEEEKAIGKIHAMLTHMFLEKVYGEGNVGVTHIQFHTEAKVVDAETFRNSKENGGTILHTALELQHQVMQEEFGDGTTNLYGVLISDGDVSYHGNDLAKSLQILEKKLIPQLQHMVYLQTVENQTELWEGLDGIANAHPDKFDRRKVPQINQVTQIFREIYKKRDKANQAAFQPFAHNYG